MGAYGITCMYVYMYKGWAFSALAPRPTVVYCASPFFDYPFSNPALRIRHYLLTYLLMELSAS
jgi:hypothetical protein